MTPQRLALPSSPQVKRYRHLGVTCHRCAVLFRWDELPSVNGVHSSAIEFAITGGRNHPRAGHAAISADGEAHHGGTGNIGSTSRFRISRRRGRQELRAHGFAAASPIAAAVAVTTTATATGAAAGSRAFTAAVARTISCAVTTACAATGATATSSIAVAAAIAGRCRRGRRLTGGCIRVGGFCYFMDIILCLWVRFGRNRRRRSCRSGGCRFDLWQLLFQFRRLSAISSSAATAAAHGDQVHFDGALIGRCRRK